MTAKEQLVEKIKSIISSKGFDPEDLYLVLHDYEKFLKYNPELIFQTACDATKISVLSATPKKKLQKINEKATTARYLYYTYMREASKKSKNKPSLGRIGSYVSRDHASVVYGIKKLKQLLEIKDQKAIDAYQRFNTLIEIRKNLI